MKKLITIITLSVFLTLLSGSTTAFASINITSPKAVLMDAQTGQVLYSKNANAASYPASTTKIMTAILALERGNLEDYVPISRRASYIDGSRIYLLEGEKVTLEQLLYSLMIESANDAAIAIAEYIGGSVEEFAVMMNDKAAQLGAENTNFTNPNGLHDSKHVTTAMDMALIAKHAMTIPKFRELVGTVRYILPETNMQDTRYLYNGNRMIKNTSHNYDGANGIKTGYTPQARSCFIGSAQRDGREYITVIMNEANNFTMWDNTISLLDYAFDNYKQLPVVKEGQIIDKVEFMGSKSEVRIVTEQSFHYNYPKGGAKPEIEDNVVIDGVNPAIPDGERVGYIDYSIDGEVIGKVRLIAVKNSGNNIMASGLFNGKADNPKYGILLFLFILPISVLAFMLVMKNRKRGKPLYIRKKNMFRRK